MSRTVTVLSWIDGVLESVSRQALWGCKWLCILLLMAMTAIELVAVSSRYVFGNALPWPEEAAKWLMIWMTFMGAPIALRLGGHAAIELLPALLERRLRYALAAAVNLIVLVLMAVLVHEGVRITWVARMQVGSATDISYGYAYAAIPTGALIMLLVTAQLFVRATRSIFMPGLAEPIDDPPEINKDILEQSDVDVTQARR